jgi:Zn-dependent protease
MSTPSTPPSYGGWLPPTPAGTGLPSGTEERDRFSPPPVPPRGEGPQEPAQGLRRLLGPLAVVAAFLFKFGKGLFVVVKGAKFLTTSASMLVSVAAYSFIWGWTFALGFVVLLFIHEMGHAIQLRREGIKTSPIVFLPFLGAVIAMKEMPKDAAMEARVGLAGPILGSIGAAACLIPFALTGDEYWQALAFVGFFLNLFNLAPVTPLDGGRAMAALTPWMWFAGLGLVFLMLFTFPNPILILIALIGAYDVYTRWKKRNEPGGRDYYEVSRGTRVRVALVYLGLLVALVIGMDATFLERDFDDV